MYEKHFRHFDAIEASNIFAFAILDKQANEILLSNDMVHYSYADSKRQYALFMFENDDVFKNVIQRVEVEFFKSFFIAIQDVKTVDDLNIVTVKQAKSYVDALSMYLYDECNVRQLLPQHKVMLKQAIEILKKNPDVSLWFNAMQIDDAMFMYDDMTEMKVIIKKNNTI